MHQIAQDPILRVEGLGKRFRSGEAELVLFENLSFQVGKGTMLAIVGQSGAGKSTLLHILAALKHHFWNKDDVLLRMLPFVKLDRAKSED